ncbi:MAG TPA: glycosyltransferase family 4 protein, partial [Mucilaginibacter sp.]
VPYNGPREKHFLFVGRLSEEKGIRLLLEAFANSPHRLRIIGDGPLKSEVEEFLKNHANVTYLGFLQKTEIETELRQSTALIFPSIWTEAFGLILIEAFAQCTSVIAPDSGSAGIIVKNNLNGLHFEIGNAADLQAKINQWARLDVAQQETYRQNAFKSYLANFTAEKNLQQLKVIYQAAVSANPFDNHG